jgi:hypothetical protein
MDLYPPFDVQKIAGRDIYEHKNVSHLNLWNSEYQLIASVNWSASDGILESLKNDSGVNVSKEQLRAALLTISKQSWSAAVGRKITSLMNKTVVDKPLRPVEVGGVLGGSKVRFTPIFHPPDFLLLLI